MKDLRFWYVHNLPEAKNVRVELAAVERAASAAAKDYSDEINVSTQEVGSATLDSWYRDSLSPILVNDEQILIVPAGYSFKTPDWEAFVTSFPVSFLRRIYRKYNTKLFSANVRDYLGSRKSDQNINHGIKRTAEKEPNNFWAFNNGITMLVHNFDTEPVRGRIRLIISGMSIVNGAQTTGALGALKKTPKEEAFVPVRLIKTTDPKVINDIIRFNNSQNKVNAPDFRSTDRIQKRLRTEFGKIQGASYEGGRRGGSQDKIKRRSDLLPSNTVGQALAAFHGEPIIAYNQKSDIWISDDLYSRYFNEQTTARHIMFCFALLRASEKKKADLLSKSKANSDSLTQAEADQLAFFRNRGSIFLFVSAMSACTETFLRTKVHSKFRVTFLNNIGMIAGQNAWMQLIEVSLPFVSHLESAISDGLKNSDNVKRAISTFHGLIQATATANSQIYRDFAQKVHMSE